MPINERKIRVYTLFNNLIWKIVFSFIFLIAFIVVLTLLIYFCFTSSKLSTTAPLAALDAVLGGTLYQVVKHYFPTSTK
jgi:hypothetical protein